MSFQMSLLSSKGKLCFCFMLLPHLLSVNSRKTVPESQQQQCCLKPLLDLYRGNPQLLLSHLNKPDNEIELER